MDLPADLGDAANISQLAGTLLAFGQTVPAGGRRHRSGAPDRQAAYLEFQAAGWRAFCALEHCAQVGAMYAGRNFVGKIRSAQFDNDRSVDATTEARRSLVAFLAAASAVRLVGNPEPRTCAEVMTVTLGQIAARLKFTLPPAGRAKQAEERAQWCKAFGQLQKEFTLLARADLGYARKPRKHRWQWWRRPEPDWPGGWPGPELRLPVGSVKELLTSPDGRLVSRPVQAAPESV